MQLENYDSYKEGAAAAKALREGCKYITSFQAAESAGYTSNTPEWANFVVGYVDNVPSCCMKKDQDGNLIITMILN